MPIDLPFVVSTLMTLLVSPLLLPFVVIRWLMTSFLWLAELTIACCHYKRAPVKVSSRATAAMPSHFITTTDSVESINGGLAKSPSEVLNPPSSSLKAASGRV